MGCFFPKVGWYHYSQHGLAFDLLRGRGVAASDSWKECLNFLSKRVSEGGDEIVVLSSEEFSNMDVRGVQEVYDALSSVKGGCEFQIVLYVRRQSDLFESVYNQKTKEWRGGNSKSYIYFLEGRLGELYNNFDYYELARRWSSVFGERALCIRVYDRSLLNEGDVVKDFFSCMGVQYGSIEGVRGSSGNVEGNVSISARALEVIRNAKHITQDVDKMKRVFEVATMTFPPGSGRRGVLGVDDKMKIDVSFNESNSLLMSNFDVENRFSDAMLFSDKYDEVDRFMLTPLDVTKVLVGIL